MAIRTKPRGAQSASQLTAGNEWEDAPSAFTDRGAIVAVYGDTGTGRTRFALTAPTPTAFAHAGEKIAGVVQEAVRREGPGRIRVLNFGASLSGSPQDIVNGAQPVWQKLRRGFMDAMVDPGWARTGIIDTHNEAWELLRLSEFGELNPQGRTDYLYGKVNAFWRGMFKWHRAQAEPKQKSMIVIGQTKAEYRDVMKKGQKTSEATGRTVSAGQKEVHYMADVVLRTSRDVDGEYGDPGGFLITIEKGWFDATKEGITLANEDVTFARVMAIITDTDESEWA